MADDNPELSPSKSPQSMTMPRKRARRLNNWPLFIVTLIVIIIVVTLAMVVYKRGQEVIQDFTEQGGRTATNLAQNYMDKTEAGVIEEKIPPPEQPPEPPPPPEKPKLPDFSDLTERLRRAREMRLRQAEAAIDGPIKVGIDGHDKRPSVDSELSAIERQLAMLEGHTAKTYEEHIAAIRAATEGNDIPNGRGRNDLSRLRQFTGSKDRWSHDARVEAPITEYMLRAGRSIPAILETEINSSVAGVIRAKVSDDVRDSVTGKHLLIPQNSTLIGEYASDVNFGQEVLFTVWTRLEFPDGKAIDLGAMPGASASGAAGQKDRVNHQLLRALTSAVMMSFVLAGIDMTQDDYSGNGDRQRMSDSLSEALGQTVGTTMAEVIRKNLNIAPTIQIRSGSIFKVMLTKDLIFDGPYRDYDFMESLQR